MRREKALSGNDSRLGFGHWRNQSNLTHEIFVNKRTEQSRMTRRRPSINGLGAAIGANSVAVLLLFWASINLSTSTSLTVPDAVLTTIIRKFFGSGFSSSVCGSVGCSCATGITGAGNLSGALEVWSNTPAIRARLAMTVASFFIGISLACDEPRWKSAPSVAAAEKKKKTPRMGSGFALRQCMIARPGPPSSSSSGGQTRQKMLKNRVLRPVKKVSDARRERNQRAEAYLSRTLERGGREGKGSDPISALQTDGLVITA